MKSSFRVGKYLISPLIRRDHHGRYMASVSIRSGSLSMTHDRLMRFTPFFDSADEAERFATAEALGYIEERGGSMPRFS